MYTTARIFRRSKGPRLVTTGKTDGMDFPACEFDLCQSCSIKDECPAQLQKDASEEQPLCVVVCDYSR